VVIRGNWRGGAWGLGIGVWRVINYLVLGLRAVMSYHPGDRIKELTLEGSSPTTVGVHPIPVPRAMFVRALTTLLFPELGGPTTIILGPRSTPSPLFTPLPNLLASNLVRSSARWIDVN
jgi:hypothetical protein